MVKGIFQYDIPYFFSLLMTSFGVITLIRAKRGLQISEYAKIATDAEISFNLDALLKKQNIDLLEKSDNYLILTVKPKGLSAWHEVHILIDNSAFHINARQIWATLVDFGTAKDVENKIIYQLNQSH